MAIAYINIGSNLGDSAALVEEAARLIELRRGVTPKGRSRKIVTPAWGYESDNDFTNMGLLVETSLAPARLLEMLRDIERGMDGAPHRNDDGSYRDRLIDIDLIAVDDMVVDDDNLTLPHPRMEQRHFVLSPLDELWPGWRHPVSGATAAEMLEALQRSGCQNSILPTAMNRKDFEIMAPVGSYESLHAAIDAGADSVYFGVEGLNMRAGSAANFTLDDLRNIASICNEAGVKTYLTVNTILFDDDLDKCHQIIDTARDAGVSAVICSDPAAMFYARAAGIPCHASTQLNISNSDAVRFYSACCDVMVMARELSLDQVGKIHQTILHDPIIGPSHNPVRIEMFCHGALCMAVSGKCYLSLHEANSSANRGACRQICRRGYTVTDKETGAQLDIDNQYIMSPKDLKTIHFLDRMVDAGVSVFKIEGRARGPEYVKIVTECYSEALQAICDGTYTPEKVAEWDERLTKVFNRGFWDGYYLGQRLGEWNPKYGSNATRVKRYVAKGVRYYSNLGVGEFYAEAGEIKVGDEVVITGPTTGALITTVESLHNSEGKPVEQVGKGELFSIAVPAKIRPSDRLYVWDVKA